MDNKQFPLMKIMVVICCVAAALTYVFFYRIPQSNRATRPSANSFDSTSTTTNSPGNVLANEQVISHLITADGDGSPALYQLLEKTLNAENLKTIQTSTSKLKAIVEVTQKTQPYGWIRDGQNRWKAKQYFNHRRDELVPLMKQLGVIDEVKPTQKQYDYALVSSCKVDVFRKRLAYLEDLWKKGIRFKSLVFLSGWRPLYADETEEELMGKNQTILAQRDDWKKGARELPTNEIEMIPWVFEQSQFFKTMEDIPATYISAPALAGNPRATTLDKIRAWVSTNPKPGSCLFISDQPYIAYQQLDFQTLMDTRFSVETAGPAADDNTTIEIYLDTLARALEHEEWYRENILNNQK